MTEPEWMVATTESLRALAADEGLRIGSVSDEDDNGEWWCEIAMRRETWPRPLHVRVFLGESREPGDIPKYMWSWWAWQGLGGCPFQAVPFDAEQLARSVRGATATADLVARIVNKGRPES